MESFYWMLVWKIFFLLKFIQIIWNPLISSQKVSIELLQKPLAEMFILRRKQRNSHSHFFNIQFSYVAQSCQLFATPRTAACQASLSIVNSQSLLKLMSLKLAMPSNHLILCYPLLLLHSIFPSIRVFSEKSVLCMNRPKYWSFSISPSNEYSGSETYIDKKQDI